MSTYQMESPCKVCNIRRKMQFQDILNKKFNVCIKCIEVQNVYSDEICREHFEISQEELIGIESYVGSDSLTYYNSQQIFSLIKKSNDVDNKKIAQIQRKKNLIQELAKRKLEYKFDKNIEASLKFDSKFGSVQINKIIEKIECEQSERQKKFTQLIDFLRENNILYDATYPCFENFLSSNISLEDFFAQYEIEHYLINNTKYLELLKIYDTQSAREIALCESLKKGKNKYTAFTLSFD